MASAISKMGVVADNITVISKRVLDAYSSAPVGQRAKNLTRLVAVSKTKPVQMIVEAYAAGHRHFGENYVEELCDKSTDPVILKECPDIRWHFIGNCQSKKAKELMRCPNLVMMETIVSEKLAKKLNSQERAEKLPVMIQVNTSGEANKNGLEPGESVECARFIQEKCPNLSFVGLMTIGDLGNSLAAHEKGENPDFAKLCETRAMVAQQLNLVEADLELSMGMSNDFEEAIRMGSTSVRVGSSIFGHRSYPTKTPEGGGDLAASLEQVKI